LPHLSGINSPKWKGGKKDIQEAIRVCAEYSDWRLEVYKRDGFMCQFCHTKGVKLNAHHLKFLKEIIEENKIKTLSDALLCKEVWFISNGITLCKSCHTSLHNQEKKELRTL
jgi:5-methylcytosine-specific restriction endonuclease McrA